MLLLALQNMGLLTVSKKRSSIIKSVYCGLPDFNHKNLDLNYLLIKGLNINKLDNSYCNQQYFKHCLVTNGDWALQSEESQDQEE